jgi:protease I
MAKVAFLIDDDFEDSEFRVPYDRLKKAGHDIEVLGVKPRKVRGKSGKETVNVEASAAEREHDRYDALVIPGGYSPDHLRIDEAVVDLVQRFAASGKPVAAICHGPSLLIEANVVTGRSVTSWPSIRTDLRNAGANWVDRDVVIDEPLITSRNPGDLEAFSDALLQQIDAQIEQRSQQDGA